MEKRVETRAHVEAMIIKAAEAKDPNDALKFSQAAYNAASAMCALREANKT